VANLSEDAEGYTTWSCIYRYQMREWFFLTDMRKFKDRYEFAQRKGVRDIAHRVLGEENP